MDTSVESAVVRAIIERIEKREYEVYERYRKETKKKYRRELAGEMFGLCSAINLCNEVMCDIYNKKKGGNV